MSSPTISIIMPAYGVERFISEAIESVLAQKFNDWELIVVDDGSKDHSAEIAAEYAAKDSRIMVVSKTNGGLSDARNFGLNYAKGEYIHFFDSDDWIEPDFYSLMLPSVECLTDIVIAGHSVEVRNVNDDVVNISTVNVPVQPLQDAHQLVKFIDFAWNKLFKREFLLKNRLTYAKGVYLVEDCEFMSRALPYTQNVRFVDNCGYHYVNRPRLTLSNTFDEKTLTSINDRIVYTRTILKSLGLAPHIIAEAIEREKFSAVKFLFHLLYGTKHVSSKKRNAIIKSILFLSNLQSISIPYYQLGLKDQALLFAIKIKNDCIIRLIYSVKSLVSR